MKTLRPPYHRDLLAANLLRREAIVGRQVSHPHVIPILSACITRDPYYVVMPLIDGIVLHEVLGSVRRLPYDQAFWIGRQVAEGLDSLHRAGWIHGDVKPANIMVSAEGHSTLLDLGFARKLHERTNDRVRALMGTLRYAAPESFTLSRPTDQRSDIYSLGVTLYEMVTGRLPFDSDDSQRLVVAHLEETPASPRQLVHQLPRSASRLLQQMLAKDPMRRPQSAAELVNALTRLEIETLALHTNG